MTTTTNTPRIQASAATPLQRYLDLVAALEIRLRNRDNVALAEDVRGGHMTAIPLKSVGGSRRSHGPPGMLTFSVRTQSSSQCVRHGRWTSSEVERRQG